MNEKNNYAPQQRFSTRDNKLNEKREAARAKSPQSLADHLLELAATRNHLGADAHYPGPPKPAQKPRRALKVPTGKL